MKILIELPTWLGDTVMTTPSIENLSNHFGEVEFTLIGSKVSIETLRSHPKVVNSYFLDKNYFNLFNISRHLGRFDLFISFRNSFSSKFLKFLVLAKKKYNFNKNKYPKLHQVEKYNNFINNILDTEYITSRLFIPCKKINKAVKKKKLGINPGASYGSAKRWYPEKFAEVASILSNEYDIIIFGGANETQIAKDIESYLIQKGVKNYQNFAAKYSIEDLISNISNLDLFITGDSGPMHLAAAFQVPTVSIFGPTRMDETSQWMNEKSIIVKKKLECQPCMKRVCPLKHHHCMKLIESSDVLIAVDKLN